MSQTASIEWWDKALDEVGVHSMDKLVSREAGWPAVVESGREDLRRAIAITGMRTGADKSIVEVGCGLGRMSAALADHFGRVVGLDVAPSLVAEAARRNTNPAVTFELVNGSRLNATSLTACDAVFSYEVFYYIPPTVLVNYFRDAFDLLTPGGQFVFHLNMLPIGWKTHASFLLRRGLYRLGIKEWRGWPTGAGLRRYHHSEAWVRKTLADAGFRVDQVAGPSAKQTWVVATKPV